ncbi:phosphate propanoyltransferase/2-acylglycerol O-acyltransferase [Acididesulfobacillus acetoxydans]|uniref:Phosphate propanoyltransferase n=1 Tax=Acididesulfobacillus acetoxydans TaxID=1561005 RepID=A0A8S0XYH7_9FIRM|nr:phosphate propanoyltransferase [Acididesulfobacillus acetoxydans]CAA7602187.1 phosphate propanoyltransferase/2-acylglycerol O-acyltransferase [Acididesulfobacillus acetoxydans]CEJ08743.1 Phosphate propanoyltransferase [Acididesulfobacillus acetoxydans]
MTAFQVPIEISNRHVHLTQEHVEALFGPGYTLTPSKFLSQPGQFACEETLTLVGPKGSLNGVRVLGPVRKQSQVELATTDTFKLGVRPPVRDSGDLAGTPGLELAGPKGSVILASGVIIAARHIHMTPSDAAQYGVVDGAYVRFEIPGLRGGIFNNVLVRVSANSHLNIHIDTDEGNAFSVRNGDMVLVTTDGLTLAAR